VNEMEERILAALVLAACELEQLDDPEGGPFVAQCLKCGSEDTTGRVMVRKDVLALIDETLEDARRARVLDGSSASLDFFWANDLLGAAL